MQAHDPYQSHNRKNLMWLVAGVALLVVSILGFSAGWLRASGSYPAMATRVEGGSPPSVTRDQGEPLPMTNQEEAKTMPKDVYDWLKHLERIERERKRLSTAQAAQLSVAMTKLSLGGATEMLKGLFSEDEMEDPKLPTEGLVADTEEKRREWSELVEDFRSLRPPHECASAATFYDEALTETRAMMLEVLDSVALAAESPEKAVEALTNMQGKSHDRIDVAGRETDGEVQRICDKYETRKWFGISSDFAGGLMDKIPSLPGL